MLRQILGHQCDQYVRARSQVLDCMLLQQCFVCVHGATKILRHFMSVYNELWITYRYLEARNCVNYLSELRGELKMAVVLIITNLRLFAVSSGIIDAIVDDECTSQIQNIFC